MPSIWSRDARTEFSTWQEDMSLRPTRNSPSWVGKLFKEKARRKLSQTAVETLAIIAYKQPITKSEIEFIRGVNADYIMKTLLEKNLAAIVGRAHSPGRPLLYGTTPDFLKHFGLNEITDLPKPREIEELLGETELEVEKRMIANQEELEFKEKLHEKLDPNSRAPHIPRKKSKLQEPHQDDEGKTVVEKMTPMQFLRAFMKKLMMGLLLFRRRMRRPAFRMS